MELGHLAEEAGWEGVFLEDYIVDPRDERTCDPWIALAAIATVTTHVILGTDVTPLARRRPWKVAREVASLDRLSNGRMVLGVGAGDWRDTSWERFGEEPDLRRRGDMLDEALAKIDRYWSSELKPEPVQRPRVPIWVGGTWPHRRPVERAARWDGALIGWKSIGGDERLMSGDDLVALREAVRRLRGGDDSGFDYVMGGASRLPDLAAERTRIQEMRDAGATWWTQYASVEKSLDEIRDIVATGPLRVT
jgi:alkanesulfonate monooxygenase SsuD/methylene tetrahydromethanopterin reductase-like flavin-dependent oxidoreductase (luciferase family)